MAASPSIVSRADEARDLAQPPAYILGMGQGHPGDFRRKGWDVETQTGAPIAKERAFAMAGIDVEDVDVLQAYDCYTYTVLVTLEDYGFCTKGEGGPFVEDGKLGPGGSAADQHRRRPAQRLLHVGHDAALRGRHPGARPGRRAPGRRSTTSCSSPATAASSTIIRRWCLGVASRE